MPKQKPVSAASMITVQDILGYYEDNPWPLGAVDAVFPLAASEEDTWETLQNSSYQLNEAADPLSSNSSIPVAGREGYKNIIGGMVEFGKGREMTSKDLAQFAKLKQRLATIKNPAVAQQLINFYGDDLSFVRRAMHAERMYLSWALVSNACNIGFVAANSPYVQGITAMDYPIAAWQKNAVGTSWVDAAADILGDIQSAIDVAETNGKVLTKIKVNSTWFTHIRKNTQIQKYSATMVQNLFDTQQPPTLPAINAMMTQYFGQEVSFEVVTEKVTRVSALGVKTTSSPFEDGVAVFSASTQLGRFAWNPIYIDDASRETYESFFLVGNYKNVDPSYSKIYSKGKGFPVIDTYPDNFYLKINGVAWS